MELTTLCYIKKENAFLMLHRIKKKKDVNQGKWIGVGGHFEENESPEDCLLREVYEETGLTLTKWKFNGIVTFCFQGDSKDQSVCEYMCLYTADSFTGELADCNEGVLKWIPVSEIESLSLWEGDRIFLDLLIADHPFFSLKLCYHNDRLTEAVLDGKAIELLDIRNEKGECTGYTRARHIVHRDGSIHGTSHVWIIRPSAVDPNDFDILLQKRSTGKGAFPGNYDISSAGHLPAGQDYLPSALRELQEELGIYASKEDLHFIGYHEGLSIRCFSQKRYHNHEFSAVYVYQKPVNINRLHLQEEEVDAVRWISYLDLKKKIEKKEPLYCIYPKELDMLAGYYFNTTADTSLVVYEEDIP